FQQNSEAEGAHRVLTVLLKPRAKGGRKMLEFLQIVGASAALIIGIGALAGLAVWAGLKIGKLF
ncbi:MAG: hypothetical protein AAB533_01460, partial [Patescibacteria group bacterium]